MPLHRTMIFTAVMTMLCSVILHQSRGASPSFDCRLARTPSEMMVCSDPSLAALDVVLAQAFAQRLQETSDPVALRRDEASWVAQRNRCTAPSCVADAYHTRLAQLGATPSSGPLPVHGDTTSAVPPGSHTPKVGDLIGYGSRVGMDRTI